MIQNKKLDALISVVCIITNEEDNLDIFLFKLSELLSDNFVDYEILVIDNNSNNKIESIMLEILNRIPSIRYIRLLDNSDKEIAWVAGLENAIGDFVVSLSIYDPIVKIPEIVDICKNGYDIVIGSARNIRKSIYYRLLHNLLRKIINKIAKINLFKNTTFFTCISRQSVNAITSSSNQLKALDVRIDNIAYKKISFQYEISNKLLSPKKKVWSEIDRAIRIMVSSSISPLRWISTLGFLGSLISIIVAMYVLAVKFLNQDVEPGWASLSLMMSIFFCFTFIILFFICEYFNRLLKEKGSEQLYSIIYEKNSSMMYSSNELNVLSKDISKDND